MGQWKGRTLSVRRTWPLTDQVKLENIETAIQILRQACGYLYNGLAQVGSATEQKIDTAKVQKTIGEIAGQIQKMQACLEDGSRRNVALSSR